MNTIEDSINQRISARIRIERESRGWSLTELAERAGVSRAMIHKIERGESSPTATLLGRLSGALGISMSTLIARAEMQEGKLLRRFGGYGTGRGQFLLVTGICEDADGFLYLADYGGAFDRVREMARPRRHSRPG